MALFLDSFAALFRKKMHPSTHDIARARSRSRLRPNFGRSPEIRTQRLLLRRWRPEDSAPFAALNADPNVVEFLGDPLTRDQSDNMLFRIERHFERHGFGLWALQIRLNSAFIGFVGLHRPTFAAAFMPCVEIGWRLATQYWGRGYATEAACAVRDFAFDHCRLTEIVSFTTVGNVRSRRVMERIGMRQDPEGSFEHPQLPEGHRLRRHVLYRVRPSGLRG